MTAKTVPPSILIGHLRFAVKMSQEEINQENCNLKSDLAGFGSTTRQVIGLRPDIAPDYMAEVLLHEVLHQCLRAANCDPSRDAEAGLKDVEERAVAAMAGPLLQTLRDNPVLVRYLTR